jgi:uncharacterized membrane protein HdeD (DUF308 family)
VNEGYKRTLDRPGVDELEGLREMSVYLLTMGVALIVLGIAVISSSFVTTLATVLVYGILLLLGAIFQVATAFWGGRRWRGFVLHLLAGVLYLVAGLFLIDNPLAAALALTLVVAACLLVGGILRIVVSVAERFGPLGHRLFVGVEMLFSGLSWLMLGVALRSRPGATLPT